MQGFAIVHLQTLSRVTRQRFTSASKSRQIVLNHEKKKERKDKKRKESQSDIEQIEGKKGKERKKKRYNCHRERKKSN